jgi:hypothetical protein
MLAFALALALTLADVGLGKELYTALNWWPPSAVWARGSAAKSIASSAWHGEA